MFTVDVKQLIEQTNKTNGLTFMVISGNLQLPKTLGLGAIAQSLAMWLGNQEAP